MTASTSSTIRRGLLLFLRFAATIVAGWLVVHYVDFEKLAAVLATLSYGWLLPILLLRLCFYFVRGLRMWQILSFIAMKKLAIFPVIGWFFVSSSFGLFTPGGIGDFSMAYFCRNFDINFVKGASAVLLDKLITLLITIIIAIIGISIYFPKYLFTLSISFIFIIMFLLILYIIWKMLDSNNPYKLTISQWIPNEVWMVSKQLMSRPLIPISLILLVLFQAIIVALQMFCALFLVDSVNVPFYGIFWLMGISRFILQVPLTIGGLGVYEGSVVYLFKRLGIAPEFSLTATLICRSITWLTSFAVVLYFLWGHPALPRRNHNVSDGSFQETARKQER